MKANRMPNLNGFVEETCSEFKIPLNSTGLLQSANTGGEGRAGNLQVFLVGRLFMC